MSKMHRSGILDYSALTWIIYQGHLSTRCPTSPTHASTKHVPRSPTYHHKVCVSTMYQTINLYHTKYQLCTATYTTTSALTMHQHLHQIVHQSCTNTCSKPCIHHAPQLSQTVHQSCTNTCTNLCINHAS
jgi:hypothetical protein